MNDMIVLKQDYYRKLFRKCRGKNSKRSMKEAFEYLEEHYTGSTRRAITHQMFRKTWEMEVEMDLYWVLRHYAVKQMTQSEAMNVQSI